MVTLLCPFLSMRVLTGLRCGASLQELPDYVQEGLEVHYAKQFDEVFAVALDHDSNNSDAN